MAEEALGADVLDADGGVEKTEGESDQGRG
jgi:hypothetical protein